MCECVREYVSVLNEPSTYGRRRYAGAHYSTTTAAGLQPLQEERENRPRGRRAKNKNVDRGGKNGNLVGPKIFISIRLIHRQHEVLESQLQQCATRATSFTQNGNLVATEVLWTGTTDCLSRTESESLHRASINLQNVPKVSDVNDRSLANPRVILIFATEVGSCPWSEPRGVHEPLKETNLPGEDP